MLSTLFGIVDTLRHEIICDMSEAGNAPVWKNSQLCHTSLLIQNSASASGKHGEHIIFPIRFSPRPFLRKSRVVEACAIIFPPIGAI